METFANEPHFEQAIDLLVELLLQYLNTIPIPEEK